MASNDQLQEWFTEWLSVGDGVRLVEVSDGDSERDVIVMVHVGSGDPPSRFAFGVSRDVTWREFIDAYIRCLEAVV